MLHQLKYLALLLGTVSYFGGGFWESVPSNAKTRKSVISNEREGCLLQYIIHYSDANVETPTFKTIPPFKAPSIHASSFGS